MKTNMSKRKLISLALFLSIFSIVLVNTNPVSGQMTGVLSFVNNKNSSRTNAPQEKVVGTKTISGSYPIGQTIHENLYEKEHSDENHIKTEIFIDGKNYEVKFDNVAIEIKNGVYDVKGTLDTKNNIVTIHSAKFVGTLFDGVRDNEEKSGKFKKIPTKKVAVFLVDYLDTSTQPFYPSTINEIMFGNGKFKRYFEEVSYGRQSITGDVFGWFTVPQNSNINGCFATPQVELAPFIANSQINLNNYTNILIINLCGGNTSYGMSNLGPQPYTINGTTYNKTVTWVNTSTNKWNQLSDQMIESMSGPHILTNLEHLLVHEFGHALGLHHAHGLSCEGSLPTENCTGVGVGNYFDVMAYNTIGLHLNAWAKNKLGWFNSNEIKTITQSGNYTIIDLASQEEFTTSSYAKAYKIKPSVNSNKTPIWIEFRNASGFDNGINTPALGGYLGGGGEVPPHNISENKAGIMIYKEMPDSIYGGVLNPKTTKLMYLRGAPNLQNSNPYQVSLNPGQTYTEPRYGLTITTLNSISQNKRRFQVVMNPNLPCTPLPPKFFTAGSVPPPQTTSPGQTIGVWVRIENMDYISCNSSNFSVSLGSVPNGVTPANFNQINNNGFLNGLEPDDERTFGLQVYFGPNTQPGQYNIPIMAINTSTGLSSTINLPITVQ